MSPGDGRRSGLAMWGSDAARMALLELWASGTLPKRRNQAGAWEALDELPWTRRTGRRGELALVQDSRGDIEVVLDRVLPEWRALLAEFEDAGEDPGLRGWKRVQSLRRKRALPGTLPSRLNRRTVAATAGMHSKVSLGRGLLEGLGDIDVTSDGVVRMRPNPGLLLARGDLELPATQLAELQGEVVLCERALRSGTRLRGELPRAVLLIENLGPYVDLAPPDGWMLVHVPGWNTPVLRELVPSIEGVPVVHFGDLDPAGVRIFRHLRGLVPGLMWAVPEFWLEAREDEALRRRWPEDLDLAGTPSLVRRAAEDGFWLEQEPLVLDPRFGPYLRGLIEGAEAET